jgi:Domain of unknown function (DUF4159)
MKPKPSQARLRSIPVAGPRALALAVIAGIGWAAVVGLAQFRGSSMPTAHVDVDKAFTHDVFTFVRIEYTRRYTGRGYGWGEGPGHWRTDWPDADLNLAFRLQQMTSLKVDPEGKHFRLTNPELFRYPFIYIVEPGALNFEEEEVPILRRYLLNGGFLMIDDFWGEAEWRNLYLQMKRVFPKREPEELPLSHEIFHCVFDLKEKPQIPNVGLGTASQYDPEHRTWERPDARTPEYKAIKDDKGRIMVMICHNTDLGDGWEREGDNIYYFKEFSEKKAYPLGINIIFYAMTH